MKKIALSILAVLLLLSIVGCESKIVSQHTKPTPYPINGLDDGNSKITVEILSNNEESLSNMPITLTPKVSKDYPNDLQYHWILENDTDFEGFVVPDMGPQKEIINDGEAVEIGLFAEVSYISGTVKQFKVRLQVEDKETSEIIATNEITIENREGVYSILK